MPRRTVSLGDITMARLTPEQLEKLKALEAEMDGIRLLAVDHVDALFAVEAKMAPRVWIPVHQVYRDIPGLRSYFQDRDEAMLTKNALKDLLRHGKASDERKRPIRVRKV